MQVPSCGLGLTMFDHQFAARSRKSLNCSVKSSRPMATGSCWNQEISPSGGNVLWLEGADKKRLLIAWQPESNGPIYPWVSLNGGVAKDLELGKRSRFMYILYWSVLYVYVREQALRLLERMNDIQNMPHSQCCQCTYNLSFSSHCLVVILHNEGWQRPCFTQHQCMCRPSLAYWCYGKTWLQQSSEISVENWAKGSREGLIPTDQIGLYDCMTCQEKNWCYNNFTAFRCIPLACKKQVA